MFLFRDLFINLNRKHLKIGTIEIDCNVTIKYNHNIIKQSFRCIQDIQINYDLKKKDLKLRKLFHIAQYEQTKKENSFQNVIALFKL